jgi:hypothetical protein
MPQRAAKLIRPKKGWFLKTKTQPESDRFGLFRILLRRTVSYLPFHGLVSAAWFNRLFISSMMP